MSGEVLRRPAVDALHPLHKRASEVRQAEFEMDAIELELAGLRRLQAMRTREALTAIGIDASSYPLPPLPRPVDQRSNAHPDGPELALHREQLRANADRRDGAARLVRVTGVVLRVY